MRSRSCCFSGHRLIKAAALPDLERRLSAAVDALVEVGVTRFLAGGALGFDTLAASCILQKRALGAPVSLILALPCPGQEARWSAPDAARYRAILQQADDVLYLSSTYDAGCMHRRNRFLVEHSAHCICYFSGARGGTAYTVALAQKSGLTICNLAQSEEEAQQRLLL